MLIVVQFVPFISWLKLAQSNLLRHLRLSKKKQPIKKAVYVSSDLRAVDCCNTHNWTALLYKHIFVVLNTRKFVRQLFSCLPYFTAKKPPCTSATRTQLYKKVSKCQSLSVGTSVVHHLFSVAFINSTIIITFLYILAGKEKTFSPWVALIMGSILSKLFGGGNHNHRDGGAQGPPPALMPPPLSHSSTNNTLPRSISKWSHFIICQLTRLSDHR